MISSDDKRTSVQVLTSEVLRCHGMEKNLQAISLNNPESLYHALFTTNTELVEVLPEVAKKYLNDEFPSDYNRYKTLTEKVEKYNRDKTFPLSNVEKQEHIDLHTRIRESLTAPVTAAILQNSGLFTAADLASGRFDVNQFGEVKLKDVDDLPNEQIDAARAYVDSRQPVRQQDGSWRSRAHNKISFKDDFNHLALKWSDAKPKAQMALEMLNMIHPDNLQPSDDGKTRLVIYDSADATDANGRHKIYDQLMKAADCAGIRIYYDPKKPTDAIMTGIAKRVIKGLAPLEIAKDADIAVILEGNAMPLSEVLGKLKSGLEKMQSQSAAKAR